MLLINISAIIFFISTVTTINAECPNKKSNSKLFCYYSKFTTLQDDFCKCSHIVLPEKTDGELITKFREAAKGVKILITVSELNQELVDLLKNNKVDGIDLNLKKLDSKEDINDFISTIRTKFGTELYVALSVPPKAEILAKYYDFKTLSKSTDLFVLQTGFLGASTNVTFHPSRLSGLWDMQNTDSIVDLVSGLGAALSKLIITAPVQGFKFRLQNTELTAPGSPAVEIQSITRQELCQLMKNGDEWTLERDQDQTGPYIFSKDNWIAFEDPTSIDIKAKYARVRGLAGLALIDLSQDDSTKCDTSILDAAFKGLSKQSRAPREAVLHSLEREIREVPNRPLDKVQVSPYRITRVIDVEGNIHSIRQDTRTEFACSRQGYFVHPRSCNRFYRCVKFDQLSDEFNVFEFDCPAGLVFDEKVEVCVWPGNLPTGSACAGSSEIAPVPKERFICPGDAGYYADPENCRWFFACLDHGKSPLSAYEFRCPYGLVFDESRLLCEWPWLVPRCASGYAGGTAVLYGNTGSIALDQYNGLGVLVTKLGGLHGTLPAPITQIYTNAGTAGLTNLGITQNAKIYTNNNGLSLKAIQALENAGLYRTGGVLLTNHGQFTGTIASNGGTYTVNTGGQQYYSQNQAANSGVAGNINIIGGGYSAVGLADSSVEITNNGAGSSTFSQVTPSPIAVTTVSSAPAVPTVTSVPLPSISTASSFQSYKGGVVANVPELQYRVENANLDFNSLRGAAFANISSVVSSTPLPSVTYVQPNTIKVSSASSSFQNHGGYIYNKPSVAFEEAPIKHDISVSSYQPVTVQPTGYYYPKPTVKFEETPASLYKANFQRVDNIQNYAYSQPTIKTFIQPTVQTVVEQQPISISTIQKQAAVQGYNYPKPSVTFEEKPAVNLVTTYQKVAPTVQTVVQQPQGYSYPKPSVVFEEKPVVQQGYTYPKPSIAFEEKPAVKLQPAVSYQSYSFQKPAVVKEAIVGYDYPKPSIAFEERPAVQVVQPQIVVSSTPTPVVKLQPAISVSTVHKQENIQGYSYPKPSIVFEEKPQQVVVSSTPATIVQPAVSISTSHRQQNFQGYSYQKPAVAFEEKPQVFVSSTPTPIVQPAISISNKIENFLGYQKPQQFTPITYVQQKVVQPAISVSTLHKQENIQGYSYPKPAIVFEERPQVSSTPAPFVQPAISVHKQEQIQGYTYQKPAVVFEEKPRPIVVSTPTPFVQQNIQPAVSISTIHKQENIQGYSYEKPSIIFEEKPAQPTPFTYVEQKVVQPVVKQQVFVSSTPTPIVQQPAVAISTSHRQQNFQGYSYQKPAIVFEEKPAQPTPVTYVQQKVVQPAVPVVKQQVIQPAVSISTFQKQTNVGYDYPKPSVIFEEKPAVKIQPTVQIQPAIAVTNYQRQEYVQPQVYVSSTQKPQIQYGGSYYYEQKPAVSTYNFKKVIQEAVGYTYPKPAIAFEETPRAPAVVSSYTYTAPSTIRPAVPKQEYLPVTTESPRISVGYAYPKPAVQFQEIPRAPAVVSSYSYTAPSTIKPVVPKQEYLPVTTESPKISVGYSYPKPAIKFEEAPRVPAVVSSYSYTAPSTVKPALPKQEYLPVTTESPKISIDYAYPKPTVQFQEIPRAPAVVSSYSYTAPSTVKPIVPKQEYLPVPTESPKISVGYSYPKPAVQFQEIPRAPAVVSTYTGPSTIKPVVPKQEYLPVTTESPKISVGYSYPKPAVKFEEAPRAPAVVSSYSYTAPSTVKPALPKQVYLPVTTESTKISVGYNYPKPQIKFEEVPEIVEEPFVKKTAYVTGTSRQEVNLYEKPKQIYLPSKPTNIGYDYPKPQIKFEEEPEIVEEPFVKKTAYVTGQQQEGYIYEKPKIKFEERPVIIENYRAAVIPPAPKYTAVYKETISYSTPKPIIDYSYEQQTPKPTFIETIDKVVKMSVQPEQNFYYYDSRLIPTERSKIEIPPPPKEYLPSIPERPKLRVKVTTEPSIEYLPVKTSTTTAPTPTREYLPAKSRTVTPKIEYVKIKTTTAPTPSREYLPVRSRTTLPTPTKEYLPSTTRKPPTRTYLPAADDDDTDEIVVATKKPARIVKVVRPKTIVKQNDYNPLLTTKLGAQCTCTSNSVRLRKKKPLQIVVEETVEDEEDEDDDDGYEVAPQLNDIIVENYQYDSQKIVEITPQPEVVIKTSPRIRIESTTATPVVVSRKRVRVRPTSKVAFDDDEEEEKKDREIVKAVRTGLKLVKQAAKDGVNEALATKDFDRYGPGGVRSRSERLQGTIDCQRAGLFRHPTQCNKFYACRWDCTKNKFTLHVFNCPVHLTFDNSLGACNWPSQGPACLENTLLPSD